VDGGHEEDLRARLLTMVRMASQGLKFAGAALDYHRGRPRWPEVVVEVATAGLARDDRVVDLGAGTGQLTQALVRRFIQVTAIEPLADLRQLLHAELPDVDLREGVAESLPLDDGSAEAIFVAEAFHWFDWQRALAEASRVLTEGGRLVLLWDVPVGPWEPDIGDGVRDVVRAAIRSGGEPGESRYLRGEWRRAFERSAFEPLEEQQIEYVFESSQDGLIAYMLSTSSIAGLPEAERQALRDELRQRLAHDIYWQRLRVDIYRTTLRVGPSSN
jgi:SAM-dependent methyltransferase